MNAAARTTLLRLALGSLAVAGAILLAAASSPASARSGGASAPGSPSDDGVAFPKIASFRAGSAVAPSVIARYDWVVTDGSGYGLDRLDQVHQLNPHQLQMIQVWGGVCGHETIAATYGFGQVCRPFSSPWGTLRSMSTSDEVVDPNGAAHQYGTVDVLNMQQHSGPDSTAIWSARVRTAYYLQDVRGHPQIRGIWGDNDFWSDQGYAWSGAPVDPRAWDDGFIANHLELQHLLPRGAIIGGNDLSSMAAHPSAYRGSVPGGWRLLGGGGQAGMKESVNLDSGLEQPDGLDGLIRSVQTWLHLKTLDGRQRYEMINVTGVSGTSSTARLALAAACISGGYLWGYLGGDFATTFDFWMPEFDKYGRHWLGHPLADGGRARSGVWVRRFEHGTVVANATDSPQTVQGITVGPRDAAFVRRENGTAPPLRTSASR